MAAASSPLRSAIVVTVSLICASSAAGVVAVAPDVSPGWSCSRMLFFFSARARVAPSPPLGLAAGRTTGPRLGAASEADHGDGGR